MPPGPVHHARLLRRPERPADPATPPAIDPNPRRRTRPALDLPHPDRITPAPRAPGHRTRHRGPCASSTSAFAGASCPPKPNCWPTPHAPSSTSTASTNPSSGPRRSVPPTCAAYNCPAPTRAASPRPSSTGPYPPATSPSPTSHRHSAPRQLTPSTCCHSIRSTGARPASDAPSRPLLASAGGESGTSRTTCHSRTSLTVKERAWPRCVWLSSRTMSRSAPQGPTLAAPGGGDPQCRHRTGAHPAAQSARARPRSPPAHTS